MSGRGESDRGRKVLGGVLTLLKSVFEEYILCSTLISMTSLMDPFPFESKGKNEPKQKIEKNLFGYINY